ncbi:uncharacterized protein [Antedon mediterranea]|uniref:uncharacterized protein n=1 Tax=Antedon mediterranea TaxID=105859 RepID=UPI003AF4E4E5
MTSEESSMQSGGKVNLVELATGLLILGKFDEVYKLCQKGLARFAESENKNAIAASAGGNAHLGDDEREIPCFDEAPRHALTEKRKHRHKKITFSDVMKECLCIIGVQALAEMSRWQDVLPFLQTQYGPVQQFPPKLVQLCMVLNVHVDNHKQAQEIYKQYSNQSARKLSSEQHTHFIELLFAHVLFPQEKWTEAVKIIETDQILKTDKKLALLKILREKEKYQKCESGVAGDDKSNAVEDAVESQSEGHRGHNRLSGNVLFLMASKVSRFVCRWIPKTYWSQLGSVAMVGLCAYLVLVRNNSDLSTWQSYTVALWFSISRLWQTMFAAYYKITDYGQKN